MAAGVILSWLDSHETHEIGLSSAPVCSADTLDNLGAVSSLTGNSNLSSRRGHLEGPHQRRGSGRLETHGC